MLHPLAVVHQVAAGADHVPDRLLRRGRDPHRGQHPGPERQRQADGVAPAGLDPVRGSLRDQRRGITWDETPIELMRRCSS